MLKTLFGVFRLYLTVGSFTAIKVILRLGILPFWKIDKALVGYTNIIDLGCGDGGLANYLALSDKSRKIVGIDFSEKRIEMARKATAGRTNISFKRGNAIKMSLPKLNSYLLVDVLHHIFFTQQKALLKRLVGMMSKNSLLVIKEVDNTNILPFWFGHIIEKMLYPRMTICTRSKNEWLELLDQLGLSCSIELGSPIFPDSTLIFICKKRI